MLDIVVMVFAKEMHIRFHFRLQFRGSRGSEDGVGTSVFFAEPLSFMISVPGMSSTSVRGVVILFALVVR
jgi:hypothetical protein